MGGECASILCEVIHHGQYVLVGHGCWPYFQNIDAYQLVRLERYDWLEWRCHVAVLVVTEALTTLFRPGRYITGHSLPKQLFQLFQHLPASKMSSQQAGVCFIEYLLSL